MDESFRKKGEKKRIRKKTLYCVWGRAGWVEKFASFSNQCQCTQPAFTVQQLQNKLLTILPKQLAAILWYTIFFYCDCFPSWYIYQILPKGLVLEHLIALGEQPCYFVPSKRTGRLWFLKCLKVRNGIWYYSMGI